ncbi:hypothetical protein C2E23DRAFT_887348 [Lenzites betulinus]|nr:hypothetical protein C2E23DRAFT_887348 [Lenzites betulinus]
MDVAPAFRIAPTDVNSTLGALLVGTFLCLILYGATVYQVHRYFEVYVQDRNLIKGYVICVFSIETFHMFTCAHACYTLLVTGYSSAGTLVRGGWSLWLLRAPGFLVEAKERTGGCHSSASVEIVDNPADSAHSPLYKRLLSAAFGSIMAADILITGMLIVVLNNSRTGMKK